MTNNFPNKEKASKRSRERLAATKELLDISRNIQSGNLSDYETKKQLDRLKQLQTILAGKDEELDQRLTGHSRTELNTAVKSNATLNHIQGRKTRRKSESINSRALRRHANRPKYRNTILNKRLNNEPTEAEMRLQQRNFIQLATQKLITTGGRRAYSFFFAEDGGATQHTYPRSPLFIKYFHTMMEELANGRLKEHINRYKCPQGYANWKWVINWLFRLHNPAFLRTYGKIPSEGDRYCFQIEAAILAFSSLQSHGKPLVLTREITKAFMNTDVPSFKAAPNDILPSFYLMLPSNTIGTAWINPDGKEDIGEYKSILVVTNNQWRKGLKEWIHHKMDKQQDQTMEFLENPIGSKRPPEVTFKWEQEMLKEENYMEDDPNAYMFKSGFKIIALGNKCNCLIADYCWEDGTTKLHRVIDAKKLKKDEDEVKCLINIVANTIITLSHNPDQVTVKSPLLERGKGFETAEDGEIPPQPITWIGEDYKPRVKYEYPEGYIPKKGTSPRTHWRKGHYRTVRQGPGRKQIHRVWIEPILVNPSKEQ